MSPTETTGRTTNLPPVVIDTSEIPPDARMLETKQVAAMLGVSVRTVWRLVAAGQLPQPVRFNRKLVRYRVSDLTRWLEGLNAVGEHDPESPIPAGEVPADLVSVWAAARLLGVHLTTVRRWINEGKLQAYSVGRRQCVSKSDVLGMIREYVPDKNT